MKQTRCRMITTIASIVIVLGLSGPIRAQVGHSLGLVNPDLGNEKELLALPHMNAKIVKEIMERRPFLKMADLNALLAQSLNKEQLARALRKDVRSDQPQYSFGRRDPDDSRHRQTHAAGISGIPAL